MNLRRVTPEPLAAHHRLAPFDCGDQSLDDWLKRRAVANQQSGASRTLVVAEQDARVRGYYALAAGAVSHHVATGGVGRNVPSPTPVMVLARLAVDRGAQGIRLGGVQHQDGVNQAIAVPPNAGVRALLVHALDARANTFYEHYGFVESPKHPLILMLRLSVTKA